MVQSTMNQPQPVRTDRPCKYLKCMQVWSGSGNHDHEVEIPGINAWVYSKPYDGGEMGGDIHLISSCSAGSITRLLVADVSGHGANVAETSQNLSYLMRRYLNHNQSRQFVEKMNDKFTHLSQAGGFATAVVMTYTLKDSKLSICNAGHPYPLIYKSATGKWSSLDCDCKYTNPLTNLPIGVLTTTNYEQFDLEIEKDDIVLGYTDSLIEAKDENGNMLGIQGLLDLVTLLSVQSKSDLHLRLLEKIRSLHPDNLKDDDVTVMAFSPNTIAPHPKIKTLLSMPKLFLNAAIERIKDKNKPIPWPAMFSK